MQPVAQAAGFTPSLPADLLKHIVDAQDRTPNARRVGQNGMIHVSSLIGFCARQHALLRLYGDGPIMESVTGGHQLVWAIGRAVEHHIRSQIIANRRSEVMGIWVCPCRETKHHGFYPANRGCPRCSSPLRHYTEMPLSDAAAGVIGNPDLLLRVDGALLVVEIKSMNKTEFDRLERPKGDHVFQAGWYRRLLMDRGFTVHRESRVIYAAKEFRFGSPYKEFPFDAEEPTLVRQIDLSREWAMTAHAAVAQRMLPPRALCASATDTRAKQCPCVVSCFSRST